MIIGKVLNSAGNNLLKGFIGDNKRLRKVCINEYTIWEDRENPLKNGLCELTWEFAEPEEDTLIMHVICKDEAFPEYYDKVCDEFVETWHPVIRGLKPGTTDIDKSKVYVDRVLETNVCDGLIAAIPEEGNYSILVTIKPYQEAAIPKYGILEITSRGSTPLFAADEEHAYIGIEYVPTQDINLTSISTALSKQITNGRAMYTIWHKESGVVLGYNGQLGSFSQHTRTIYGVSAQELVISDNFSNIKLRAGEKYIIYLNALQWDTGATNYHYYYTKETGNYITSEPSISGNITAYPVMSNYEWVGIPAASFAAVAALRVGQCAKYTGNVDIQIGAATWVNKGDVIGIDSPIGNFIGEFNYLPGGAHGSSPNVDDVCFLTEGYWESKWGYNAAGLYKFDGTTWKSYYITATSIKSYMANVDVETDRKYYLTVVGE